MIIKTLLAFFLLGSFGNAFTTGPRARIAVRSALNVETGTPKEQDGPLPLDYGMATDDFTELFPQFAKWGWGPTVHSEKWNGRHAMFGWLFICATAYAKGHGLIPNPTDTLNLKQWGTLATISGKDTISNERAIILFANVHFFGVSLMSTICPLPFNDPLLLDPNHPSYERCMAREDQPFGYMPEYKVGLTEEAECLNGRLAMVGIFAVIATSCWQNKPIVDVVNEWVGGAYTMK